MALRRALFASIAALASRLRTILRWATVRGDDLFFFGLLLGGLLLGGRLLGGRLLGGLLLALCHRVSPPFK